MINWSWETPRCMKRGALEFMAERVRRDLVQREEVERELPARRPERRRKTMQRSPSLALKWLRFTVSKHYLTSSHTPELLSGVWLQATQRALITVILIAFSLSSPHRHKANFLKMLRLHGNNGDTALSVPSISMEMGKVHFLIRTLSLGHSGATFWKFFCLYECWVMPVLVQSVSV